MFRQARASLRGIPWGACFGRIFPTNRIRSWINADRSVFWRECRLVGSHAPLLSHAATDHLFSKKTIDP
jgi:hypothetical protein